MATLKETLADLRAAVTESEDTDTMLKTKYIMLRNTDGVLCDKQPLSRLCTYVAAYCLTEEAARKLRQGIFNYYG